MSLHEHLPPPAPLKRIIARSGVAQVPIWKREVYEGDERAWKQNKEWQHPEASRQDATDTSR
eukprot:6196180-Pleurochrysis_carterae.AAC.1